MLERTNSSNEYYSDFEPKELLFFCPFYQNQKSFEKKKLPGTHSHSPGKPERGL